jgi:hypothetical protein
MLEEVQSCWNPLRTRMAHYRAWFVLLVWFSNTEWSLRLHRKSGYLGFPISLLMQCTRCLRDWQVCIASLFLWSRPKRPGYMLRLLLFPRGFVGSWANISGMDPRRGISGSSVYRFGKWRTAISSIDGFSLNLVLWTSLVIHDVIRSSMLFSNPPTRYSQEWYAEWPSHPGIWCNPALFPSHIGSTNLSHDSYHSYDGLLDILLIV